MIAYFTKHPTAANLLMLVFLAAGILSLPNLRRETFPDFRPTEVEIRIPYLGATAEEVEETICQRVEDALDGVRFVKEVRSDARENLAIVTVEMAPGGEYPAFKDEIDTQIATIDDLPPDTEEPVITHLHRTDQVLSILVAGALPRGDLKTYCEDFKDRLQRIPEVSLVRIGGFSDRQFRIELSEEALKRHALSVAEVAAIIGRQNVDLPAGAIETDEGEITVRFVEERTSVRGLESLLIIAGPEGGGIRLGDIANVRDVFELDEERVLLRGKPAALVDIEMTRNQDVIRVADAVKRFVEEERQRYPALEFVITRDASTLVQDRLQLLANNGWQGMLLVFLTMWLFFNVRLSFWVVMSLPVSFLGAFFLMPHLGLTVNMMTMVGMLLALGILMDDGIVIAENIATHRAAGKSPIEAAIVGVNEVKSGVFSSFVTTVCVLGPLAFLAGDIGTVLEVVPLVLILVLTISLVEAFFILPAHLAHSMHHYDPKKVGRTRRLFERAIEWMRERAVGSTLDLLLRWRYAWVGLVVGVFLVSIGMLAGGVLKFQAFPDMDGDVIEARLVLAPGSSLEHAEAVVRHVTDALDRVNARFAPFQSGGRPLVETVYVRFNWNPDAFENGPHVATVTADLLTAQRRNARLDDVFAAWREEVGRPADVLELNFTEPVFGPQGRNIEIRLMGDRLVELDAAASDMKQWFSDFAGVSNLSDDLRIGKPELQIRAKEAAMALGLDAETMARQIRSAFQGVVTDEVQVGEESYEIDVRFEPAHRDTMRDLESFYFTLDDGKKAPLGTVAEVTARRGWSRIARVNGERTVTVHGDVDSRVTNTAALISQLSNESLPELSEKYPQVRVSIEGETKEGTMTRLSILRGMLIGLLGVFILLSFQFESYTEPLVVMIAIPLALIGVVAGHLIMRINLSMPSILGFVSLAGIVVNDSILLVLFLKQQRSEGTGLLEAASMAGRKRFRAIILTSLTTIAGLLPLLAERSLQAQILIPLATSIAFGLLASTILVLFVIPSAYVILGDLRLVQPVKVEKSQQG